MYDIQITPAARKQLDKIDNQMQRRLQPKIDELAIEPRPRGVKKLVGEDNLYRVRVGDFRILYTIEDDRLIVLVVKIADRKQAY